MRKPKEIEELIKRAIRDEIALHPLKSVAQVRGALFKQGYQALNNPLDWHYIARLMRTIRGENLQTLTNQSRDERIANLKERHRLITQKLADILDGKPISRMHDISYPTHADRVSAANTILKWDMAMFFAEEQTNESSNIKAIEARDTETKPIEVFFLDRPQKSAQYSRALNTPEMRTLKNPTFLSPQNS